ncbi:nitroreductase family protein [Paenibacillus sp. ACRRX]|uniref:nitroreductase family protein n=1 Tax=Paenibacillus sp. ACRRX TaxID=2918206 RepID=UPI001EF50381|nr:nitroreductase family protein [Paenibacillus sp. ACRRX]MCG7406514.1 nitroreductase family protein [Paenibacillus sp. ACRRX]
MEILDDAVWAPNHRNREPWSFRYTTDAAQKRLAKAIAKERSSELGAIMERAAGILIVAARQEKNAHIASEDYAAACCLVRNVQLLGWSRGLGMYWEAGDFSPCKEILSLTDIGSHERVVGLIAIGYRDGENAVQDKVGSHSSTIKIEHW